MKNMLFSVAMCVYGGDCAEHFKTAVDSVLNQTVLPQEIVIVVDGPVPSELDTIISEYEKMQCFKVVRLEKNQGHGVARRTSLMHCSYDWVALMDADDICLPYRFERQVEFISDNPDISIVGGNIAEFIGDINNIVGHRIVPSNDDDIKVYMRKRCPMNQMTVMFKKNVVESVGGYIDWYCEEDYYLWIRMCLAGAKFANIPEVLVNVRVGKEMYRRRGGWKYFKSEVKLQEYMLKNKIVTIPTFVVNVVKRLIVQVLMPNKLRGWVFQKFART